MTSTPSNGSRTYLFSIVLVAIIGGLLFGYDTAVISGAEQALDQFFRTATDFNYTSWLHGFTASSALVGCVIGGVISGVLASRLGRKRSLIVAAILFFLSAVGSWWPESGILPYGEASLPLLVLFNIYRIIGGVGVGLASALCPMYIAEISPARIRGTLVSCNQFAIIFGMLVVYFVNYLIRNNLGDTAEAIQTALVEIGWRRMFLSEAYPAGAFLLLILLVPETPRFLALKGKDAKAFAVLERARPRPVRSLPRSNPRSTNGANASSPTARRSSSSASCCRSSSRPSASTSSSIMHRGSSPTWAFRAMPRCCRPLSWGWSTFSSRWWRSSRSTVWGASRC